MDPRIQRKAEELGDLLAASDEFKRLQENRAAIAQHSAAQIMLRDLQQRQEKLQRKQANGEEITQAEINDLQRVSQVAAMNPYVRGLYESELAFGNLMAEVQRVMFKAVGIDVPAETEDAGADPAAEAAAQEEKAAREARSKLWVPGQ